MLVDARGVSLAAHTLGLNYTPAIFGGCCVAGHGVYWGHLSFSMSIWT